MKVSPEVLKGILVRWAYKVAYQDEHNWLMESVERPEADSIFVPKCPGEDGTVGFDVLHSVLIDAKLDLPKYFALRAHVLGGDAKGQHA